MKIRRLLIALAATGSLAASQAAAQGVVHQIQEVQPPISQESPSDLAVPVSSAMYGDSWQKDDDLGYKDGKIGGSCGTAPFELYPTDSMGIKIGGWTQFGYHNRDSVADLFNQNADQFNLHQQWLYVEREANGSCGLDWGFRFDAMYGIDADNTQAFGNNFGRWDFRNSFQHGQYGWALPQAYLELAYGDLSIIGGHFYTTIGYEVVPAPDNFFYSHAFTMNNSEPFTHTGLLGTYEWTDRLTLFAGWTLGWDTGFDQFGGGNNWLGGFSYALTDSIEFIYMSTYGDFGRFAFVDDDVRTADDNYSHSIVLDVSITERLNYVFQSDYLDVADINETVNVETIGINQYLIYTLNDCWAVGARVEWWRIGAPAANVPRTSVNAATFGVNYRPHPNLVFRPEIKHEWVPAADVEQTIFGVDMVLTY
jgi:hypothetical protein